MRGKKWLGVAMIVTSLTTVVGVAVATTGSGFTVTPIVSAEVADRIRITQAEHKSTVVADFTFEPGGTTGWHTHPGPTMVLVKEGEFTLHRNRHGKCRTETYGPGEAFVERPSSVHMGSNEGDVPTRVVAVFFRIADDGVTRIDQPDPGVC
jgi:quercetin dioxygenase-like cupin family protein